MNGSTHYDGRAPLNHHAPHAPLPEILRQCPRCWGRMTGFLAGWMARGPLPGYDIQNLCTACLDTLALEPPDSAELVTWAAYLARQRPPKHKRTPRRRQQKR